MAFCAAGTGALAYLQVHPQPQASWRVCDQFSVAASQAQIHLLKAYCPGKVAFLFWIRCWSNTATEKSQHSGRWCTAPPLFARGTGRSTGMEREPGCLRLGVPVKGCAVSSWGWVHKSGHRPRPTEPHTSEGRTLWHVNYISVKNKCDSRTERHTIEAEHLVALLVGKSLSFALAFGSAGGYWPRGRKAYNSGGTGSLSLCWLLALSSPLSQNLGFLEAVKWLPELIRLRSCSAGALSVLQGALTPVVHPGLGQLCATHCSGHLGYVRSSHGSQEDRNTGNI